MFRRIMGFILVSTMILSLTACGGNSLDSSSKSGSGGDISSDKNDASKEKSVITITYREDGQGEKAPNFTWIKNAYETWDMKDQVELDLAPISASEGDYFAKVALQLQSPKTAPDLLTEDSFQLSADVEAGYLTDISDYVKDFPDFQDGKFYEKIIDGYTIDGRVYAIPYSADTRGLWYNRELLDKAGYSYPWQPNSWDDILEALAAIKETSPDVFPIWMNAGVATGEGTTMQTYEMLLYGTGEKLQDEDGKYIIESQAILDTLNMLKTIFTEGYGPDLSLVLNGQTSNTLYSEYFTKGKTAISLDGNWAVGRFNEDGMNPWPGYEDKIGFAAMPTQKGQEPGFITMSGGWGWAIPENADNKDVAFQFMKHLMSYDLYLNGICTKGNITVRKDIAEDEKYANQPFYSKASSLLDGAYFRPKEAKYAQVSTAIQTMVESVVTGTSPEDAIATYGSDVIRMVGEENVVRK